MTSVDRRDIANALKALAPPGSRLANVDGDVATHPGLYAFHASQRTWLELGLGRPPDRRPLYIGKAEGSLAARDLRGHFAIGPRSKQSPTGSSTFRRSLAALLAESEGFHGVPRNPEKPSHFANFGLNQTDDDRLSGWMKRRLKISLWRRAGTVVLDDIETVVLQKLMPPLNLSKISTRWKGAVKDARRILADEARRSVKL